MHDKQLQETERSQLTPFSNGRGQTTALLPIGALIGKEAIC
jgi:hypothetical protein